MKRTETRIIDGEFCRLEVELRERDGHLELSICGTAGYVTTPELAREQARDSWVSYFEEMPEERLRMSDMKGELLDDEQAAEYVLEIDGEYHGLDVLYGESDDEQVLVAHSCGQIRDELARFFPEVEGFFRFHLNGLHAECEHQQARGESYKTHPGAECLDCGWKLGHGWHKRSLPESVIHWAKTGEGKAPELVSCQPEGTQEWLVQGKRSKADNAWGQPCWEQFELRGWATDADDAHAKAHAVLHSHYDQIHVSHVLRVVRNTELAG